MKTLKQINAAFTLLEVMVSSALIVVIMGFLMYTMDQTQRTMRGADSRIGQFQTARVAFEAMTRNLSQATLNTYYDLDSTDKGTNGAKLPYGETRPTGYRRASDLHFVSGLAASAKILDSTEVIDPTHAVFFQAPLGVSYQDDNTVLSASGYEAAPTTDSSNDKEVKRKYRFLNGLMNVCGYYIHWSQDQVVPTFLKDDLAANKIAPRYRYRLMEVTQPAETVAIYNNRWYTKPGGKSGNFVSPANEGARSKVYENATDWIKVAVGKFQPTLGVKTDYSRPLADNIVAMIIVPKLPESDRKQKKLLNDLTLDYEYDSRPDKVYDGDFTKGTTTVASLLTSDQERSQYAQLPPILQVTLVAIDEDSGAKLENSISDPKSGPSEHWAKGLFKNLLDEKKFNEELGAESKPSEQSLLGRLAGLDDSLKLPKMNFRIFTTDVVMRSAKWTNTNQ